VLSFLTVYIDRRSVRLLLFFSFIFPAGIFSRTRNSPLLSDLFHFPVPIGAMVVAALFLTRSGRGRVLYDDPPVLGDRMA
jgi:hypothetical protein